MTPVDLESTLHETQDQPHSSLPLTPRPPIDGEPCECKQEVADNVVMAGHTNGTAKMANPPQIADVDRTATLGIDLATAACGVDEGDGTERRDLRLQQTNLLCEETRQCNGNVEVNIPIANRLPLEGEWTVYPSCEMKNSNGGDTGREVEPTDMPNKSEMLVTVSIESEDPHSGDTPCVYLGGTRMRADDTNGLGC